MQNSKKITRWSAREVVDGIAKGEISTTEYASELLKLNKAKQEINAFITLDEAHVMKCAAQTDNTPNSSRLRGLPIGFKDAIGTSELPTTGGTPALKNHKPKQDAAVVAQLKSAGGYVFGKLNLHELSYGITSNNGCTNAVRNPHNLEKIPGGSSGGAAAAVAAGLIPAAIGTDTGGSVRIPACLCGVVGFRPSIGRYSQKGIIPVSHTRDTAGPLCRSVDDVAMIDAAITGVPDSLEHLSVGELCLGLPNQYFLENLHPQTRATFEARLQDLRSAGWNIKAVDLAEIEPLIESCGFAIAVYETKHDLIAYLAEHAPDGPSLEELIKGVASPDVQGVLGGLLESGFEDMADAYQDAIANRRPKLQRRLADCFAINGVDALIFPTTILPACSIGDDETTKLNGVDVPTFPTYIHNTDPGSIAGIPGISVPAGLTPDGLPVGIELDGPNGSDRRLLAVANLLEKYLPTVASPKL